MTKKHLLGFLCLLILPGYASGTENQNALAQIEADPQSTLDSLSTELPRSVKELKADDGEAPYFISYRLVERESVKVRARFGALLEEAHSRKREVAVDVRVGSYTFDSRMEKDDGYYGELGTFEPSSRVPVDNDSTALRTALWLLTDSAYKDALSSYFRKKAKRVNRVEKKPVDSLSQEEAIELVEPIKTLEADRTDWAQKARTLSGAFKGQEGIVDGSVVIRGERVRTWLVNSESSKVIREYVIYSVSIDGVSRAPDGLFLEQGKTLYGRTWNELHQSGRLDTAAQAVRADLEALRTAPVADPYTGPAILEAEATGVFFHETLGHRLEGERQNDEEEGQTFKGQLGTAIIPTFVTVRDDPTLSHYDGHALNGWYGIDDEGVKARNVVLVENGVLKTFLTSRTPIEGVAHSNGHGRAQGTRQPMARMGNLIIEGAKPVPRSELKAMLIAEVKRQGKPYGLIIRDISGGSTNTSSYGYQAFKGTPRMVYRVDAQTGEETLVRGVEMVGTPLTAMSKLMATSRERGVFNGYCGAESGYVPVSTIAPSTLFREIELQRTTRTRVRAPIMSPPW